MKLKNKFWKTKGGPLRVWFWYEDKPGLAMTWSIGDHEAWDIGIICDPEIKRFDLNEDSKFIVFGSDGLFEYISNQELFDFITQNKNLSPEELS